MKAIAIVPGAPSIKLVERPEPEGRNPDDVRLKVLRVGICGTDRDEVTRGLRARAPEGHSELVIGHEMLGEVVDVGSAVTLVKPGDLALFTVRRGCGRCISCTVNRSDMCQTGNYKERGIWKLDGYQTGFVVDKEQYVIHVPPEIGELGVLAEPLSVAEKAIDEAVRVQQVRLPDAAIAPIWLLNRRCLVAGLGPIGLLAALALRLRGARVWGMDIVNADTMRPQWLTHIGGRYIDGRNKPIGDVKKSLEQFELIFDATGVAKLEFDLLQFLSVNGVYVVTGIPGDSRSLNVPGADLIRQLVLGNQLIIGSVNAARDHFQMAVQDLAQGILRWGDHLGHLITHVHPFPDFEKALKGHPPDEIKAVIEWDRWKRGLPSNS